MKNDTTSVRQKRIRIFIFLNQVKSKNLLWNKFFFIFYFLPTYYIDLGQIIAYSNLFVQDYVLKAIRIIKHASFYMTATIRK